MRTLSALTFLSLSASLAVTACSLVIDPEQKQCSKTSQCAAPYLCADSGYCEKQAGCKDDKECRAPGICIEGTCEKPACTTSDGCAEGELCNTETSRCIPERDATCATSDACKVYEGAQVCVKAEGRCDQLECRKKTDCGTSPTVSCVKGSCEDPAWGCLGRPDRRMTDNMSSEGSLEIKVTYIFPTTGEAETGVANLRVRVCEPGDAECVTPVTEDYSYKDRILTIRGLENGKTYTIRLLASHPTTPDRELLETEYQMYRTVQGKTVEPRPIVMFERSFREATATVAEVSVDPELGMVLAYVLDCNDTEVPGVSIGVDMPTVGCNGDARCATTAFYFTTANLPDPDASQTGLAGRLGVVNIPADVPNRLTLTRVSDNLEMFSFSVVPRKDIITFTFLYPEDFGTSAD